MEIDITQSTYVNEQANSPQLPAESALLQEEVKQAKQMEKAT